MYATIQKWGNSHGIRLPKNLLDAIGVTTNDRVELVQAGDTVTIKKAAPQEPNAWNLLTQSDYYKVWKLVVKDSFTFEQEHPFLIVSVLEGRGIIESHSVGKGDHLLIPAGYGRVEMLGDMEIIASTAVETSGAAQGKATL